jgi:hypothetical protein
VSIMLSGLAIKLEVTVAYVRNETSWMVDFFNFNSAAASNHSANGTGRTCANHAEATYAGLDFSQWWGSQPRADFDNSVHASITNALGSPALPNWVTTGTKWVATKIGCDKVKSPRSSPRSTSSPQASTTALLCVLFAPSRDHVRCMPDCLISHSRIAHTSQRECRHRQQRRADSTTRPTSTCLHSGRGTSTTPRRAGYYKASFVYPFSFHLQQTVTDLSSTSSKWAFAVRGSPSPSLLPDWLALHGAITLTMRLNNNDNRWQ